MKYTSCPQCEKPWNENEIEFQVCDECGYENPDRLASIKISSKKLLRSALGWLIVILGTAICLSIYHYATADTSKAGHIITFVVSSFVLIILTRKIR